MINFGFGFTNNKRVQDWHAVIVTFQPLSVSVASIIGIVIEYRADNFVLPQITNKKDEEM